MVVEFLVSFERLLRSVGYVHRVIVNIRKRVSKETEVRGPLNQEELKLVKNTIYPMVQQQAYPDEISVDPQ